MTSSTAVSSSSLDLSQAWRSRPRTERERAFLLQAERFRRNHPGLQEWSAKVRVENSKPLDFDAYPFQPELIDAFGDRELETVDVMKSAQCGISAIGVSLALYAPDIWEGSTLYVLPTEDFAYQFSDTRIKPAIEDSPYLRTRVAGTDNKGLKKVGKRFAYFVGSGSERRALSIPADVLILDEYDRLFQALIPAWQKRLGAVTSMKLQRRFSNPSFPDTGIDELYLATDQRQWLVTCPKCSLEAPINWEAGEGHFVDEDLEARVCGKCRKPLSREAIAGGRWVAAKPGVDRRGYHISKLVIPDERMAPLVEEHRKSDETSIEKHFNFDLGLPYAAKGGSLTKLQVLACRVQWDLPPEYSGPAWVTSGVDVGRVLHVRISQHLPDGRVLPLYIGEVDDFGALEQLWRRYDVKFGLVDERPEERAARAFEREFRGRCLLARFSGDDQRDPIVIDDEKKLVVIRRAAACDRLIDQFLPHTTPKGEQLGPRRLLPRSIPKEPEYLKHLTTPHRVVETTKGGQKVPRYQSDGKPDHYFFAELYDLVAKEARGGPAFGASGPPPKTVREQVRTRGRR